MARRPWHVVLATKHGARHSTALRVESERPARGIDDIAAFEVSGVRKSEAVATVLRWLLLGRPRIMMVEQLWGHAVDARAEGRAALACWHDQQATDPATAGESLAAVVRRYVTDG